LADKTAYILTGEYSGEMYAAGLASHLIRQNFKVFALGSELLSNVGAKVTFDYKKLSVVGLVEVIEHYTELKKAFDFLVEDIKIKKPDVLICIDFPDFNIRIAKKVKPFVKKLIYFIPPQVWAWRRYRAKFLSALFDRIFVLFPFEKSLYDNAEFLGHPLAETVKEELTKEEFEKTYKLQPVINRILLLPGSRKKEFTSLMPVITNACKKLSADNIEFILLLSPTLKQEITKPLIEAFPHKLTVINNKHKYSAIKYSSVAIGASGTITLECGLLQTPMCALYKLNLLTYLVGLLVVTIDYFTIPNIVLDCEVFKELVNDECNAKNINNYVVKVLFDKEFKNSLSDKLKKLKSILYKENSFQNIAKRITNLI
jgi:lipid-A-disaccharide synthase